jgi:hypothetical protein
MSRVHREYPHIKYNNPIQKWVKNLGRHFSKGNAVVLPYQWGTTASKTPADARKCRKYQNLYMTHYFLYMVIVHL